MSRGRAAGTLALAQPSGWARAEVGRAPVEEVGGERRGGERRAGESMGGEQSGREERGRCGIPPGHLRVALLTLGA